MPIELRAIDRNNFKDVIKLKVRDDETKFVAPNMYSVAEAYVEAQLSPREIYADGQLVGFIKTS